MVRSQTRTSARRRVPPLMSPLIHLRIKTAAGKTQKNKKNKTRQGAETPARFERRCIFILVGAKNFPTQ